MFLVWCRAIQIPLQDTGWCSMYMACKEEKQTASQRVFALSTFSGIMTAGHKC